MDHGEDDERAPAGGAPFRRAGSLDATLQSVRGLLDAIADDGSPLPARGRIEEVLTDVLHALSPAPATKPPSRDLVRALDAMASDPGIVSTGDLGRALEPGLNTEKACSLGGNRMRQMLGRGWVVRERFARWKVTDEGRAAHLGMSDGRD